jgi:hypothetical protein
VRSSAITCGLLLVLAASTYAAENLKINPKLDYSSDSQGGPLITGAELDAGFVRGQPACVLRYGEACFNSKRQARRTVELYHRYKGRVQFVIVDLDRALSPAQAELKNKYYAGYIPHDVILSAWGSPLYNSAGEIDSVRIARMLDQALR